MLLFYGWSDVVPRLLTTNFPCIMLHPSPLPKYRGGSPIQNQIIRGEIDSAVTLFLMDDGIDTGPIIKTAYLSLEGRISEIFDRIQKVGLALTQEIFDSGYTPKEQIHADATYFARRKPSESEITQEELLTKSAVYLKNKIRMLEDPYPSAFIRTADHRKLYIHDVSIEE